MSRSVCLFLGPFLCLQAALGQDVVLFDLRPLPPESARVLLLLAGLLLAARGIRWRASPLRRLATALAAGGLAIDALVNTLVFYRLVDAGRLAGTIPLPLSLVALAATASVALSCRRADAPALSLRFAAAGAVAIAALLPFLEMACFGPTDYRRPADAAIVFGARTYDDGRLSRALADRVRTAAKLQREGLVPRILLSGGPGDGAVHETEAMRRLALSLGVPASAILVDPDGLSTRATMAHAKALASRLGLHRWLAVSQPWHLPRVKMAARQAGLRLFTVPAEPSGPIGKTPILVIREAIAWWAYRLGLA